MTHQNDQRHPNPRNSQRGDYQASQRNTTRASSQRGSSRNSSAQSPRSSRRKSDAPIREWRLSQRVTELLKPRSIKTAVPQDLPRGVNGNTVLRDSIAPFIFKALSAVFCVAIAYLLISLFNTQILSANEILDKGSPRVNTVKIKAQRGTIYDRNGVVLATTVDAVNVFCHPSKVPSSDVDRLANALAEACGGTADEYKEKILTSNSEDFSYIVKLADAGVKDLIKELGIEGVDYEETVKRVYPCNEVASQLIGFINSDGEAVSGLELYYNDILAGQDGKKQIEYSSDGFPVPGGTKVLEEKIDGKDIVLSIDVEMQRKVESSLANKVEEVEGTGGTAIVMDSKTGEIYAAASWPTFDVTDLSTIEDNAATTIRGITQAFEPGSVFKAVTMLAALEEGTTQAGQVYYCPEELEVDEYVITDSHEREAQEMDTSKIMADSSNIGMSLIGKDLGWENLYNYIQKYLVTDKTGVDYPGENSGSLSSWENWSETQGMNITFGQGLTTTPIEIVRFYGALANNGYACTPHFLVSVPADENTLSYESTEIIENKQAISDLTEMLKAVVEYGTGTDAQIDGYEVAGKTGTAEVASELGGYKEGEYNISFVGYLPDTSTNFVCFVGANDVPGERKTVSAFRDIMAFAVDRYNITQN
ncbi:MAG: peptidoglycan D,D-transpeptidase FtsI family protein [Anaerotardibacter sp.]